MTVILIGLGVGVLVAVVATALWPGVVLEDHARDDAARRAGQTNRAA